MEEHRFANEIGNKYELYKLASPYYENLHQKMTQLLRKKLADVSSPKVFEIGFGTGFTSKAILEASPRIWLVGIDNEPMMLDKAKDFLKTFLSQNRMELAIGDALDELKKIPSDKYDAVVSGFVIHNFHRDYRSSVLKEIYRVLKPTGIFINGDKIAADDITAHRQHYDWQIEQFQVYKKMGKPELTDEWVRHYEEDEKPERILRESEFFDELHNLGFKEVELQERWQMDAVVSTKK